MSIPSPDDTHRPNDEFLSGVKRLLAEKRLRKGPTISADALKREAGPPSDKATISPYECAAAVLSWFEPDTIKPLQSKADRGLLTQLLTQSVVVAGANGENRWALLPEKRIAALRAIRESNSIHAAQTANSPPDDPIQTALDTYLAGQAKPIEQQTLAELTVSHQVSGWLREAGFQGLPPAEAIARRTEWLALLQPFEHLAGGSQFRGRVEELRRLRSYVGVLPPGSFLESARRSLEQIFKLSEKPPLSIFGPGGVGKSTLLARFILDHALAHEADRFPFVYLDCDRPEVDASEPLTLLVEAARQLGIEYPEASQACEKLRNVWAESMAKERQAISTQSAGVQDFRKALGALRVAVRDFASTVSNLGGRDSPVLFVIDTFEEVQWRSVVYVDVIWKMLEQLQAALPRLRVVIAGRAELGSRTTEVLALTGLDEEASIAYLQGRGISDELIARRVARQIGGSPLSLKLAAELAQREGLDSQGRLAVSTHEYFFLKLDASLLQRQLYKRILSHVHDDSVRKLSHPGLVLRRITPDLILKVLAGPCGIEISSLAEAEALFDKLQREVSLVTIERDGALRHRQDLRLVMLELLRGDDAEKVKRIHEAAVAYYEARPAVPSERAEEIYHRLQLDQEPSVIDSRWIDGLDRFLASAVEEFSGRRLAYLATRLNFDVNPETRALADLQDWEKITERNVSDLLAHDQSQRALELMRARADRSITSPLVPLEARALTRLERWEDALLVLDTGFRRTVAEGERAAALSLALQAAEVVLTARLEAEVPAATNRLAAVNAETLSPIQQIEAVIRQLALAKLNPSLRPDSGLRARFVGLFDGLGDDQLMSNPGLGHWAAIVFEPGDAFRLARVIQLCGFPQGNEQEVRQFASELTSFDAALSKDFAETPGVLAREARIQVKTSLTGAWSDFLLTALQGSVREALSGLLRRHADFVPVRLLNSFAELVLASLGIRHRLVSSPEPPKSQSAMLRPKHVRQLQDALKNAFSPPDFAEFLRSRLDRNVEAISAVGSQPFATTIANVIRAAQAEGWIFDLATQAYFARPSIPAIAALATELGLTVVPSEQSLKSIVLKNRNFLDSKKFLSGMERLSAQICRVEIGNDVKGTGFLVGVDLLLTADHVLSDVLTYGTPRGDVVLRFDYREAYGGDLVAGGTVFGLADEWLVATNEYMSVDSGLGYALLRIAGSPGAQPVGGAGALSSDRLRGWIEFPPSLAFPVVQERIVVLGHPEGKPLQISMGQVIAISSDRRLLHHDADTSSGSSGAPCLNEDLQLVGMHLGTDRSFGPNFGVTLSAIVEDLENKKLGQALRTHFR
jgi:V8-like Glu-specific endopeptidase